MNSMNVRNKLYNFVHQTIKKVSINQKFIDYFKRTVELDVKNNQSLVLKSFDLFNEMTGNFLNVVDSAFLFSAENGYIEALKYSVLNGANIHLNGDIVLKMAFNSNQLEIVSYLVDELYINPVNKNVFLQIDESTDINTFVYLYEKSAASQEIKDISCEISVNKNAKIFNYLLPTLTSDELSKLKHNSGYKASQMIESLQLKRQLDSNLQIPKNDIKISFKL